MVLARPASNAQSDLDLPAAAYSQRLSAPPQPEENAWRSWFERRGERHARFPLGENYLRRDIGNALGRAIPRDAQVLEVGAAHGDTLAALPNRVRHGIDYMPEAVQRARTLHPAIEFGHGDALTFQREERYDAIILDRLVHSVPDIQHLLENAAAHLSSNGRIYMTCFNYAWEGVLRAAELAGLKQPAPPANWLGDTDLENLFTISGLQVVKHEERLLLPLHVPLLSELMNRYVAKIPPLNRLALYRLYVLRKTGQGQARTPKVTVVVPARNEAGNIPNIVARTPVMGAGTELVFVEGGSTDDTRAAIEQAIADYRGPLKLAYYTQTGKGKGDAVRVGFGRADGDLLMILDADLTVPPEDLPKFYDVMVSGLTDYVHGTRLVYPMERQAMRFLNKLGNIGFSKLFSFLLNQPIKDTLCGTKVLWKTDYERIVENRSFFGDFDPFGDFDLIFGAAKLNLKLLEIPVRYRDRTYGTTNISRFRHGWLLLQMSVVAAKKLKFT